MGHRGSCIVTGEIWNGSWKKHESRAVICSMGRILGDLPKGFRDRHAGSNPDLGFSSFSDYGDHLTRASRRAARLECLPDPLEQLPMRGA